MASSQARVIRVLVADDHPVMREGLCAAIDAEPDMRVVAAAGDGAECIARFREQVPDVALVDLQMPGVDGLGAIAAVHGEFPASRIMVLTTYPGDARIKHALALGASGYLLKSATREDILDAIRQVAAGRRTLAPEAALDLALYRQAEGLTDKELEVLRLAADGHTNKRIAARLHISEDSVKARMRNILAKLKAGDRTHAVTIALRRGFLDR
ncbi:response regulator [Frateuria defendens]|uniref:response regulator n=1 Tax=Frateuria defendens TaxID=2219559 RepID=UPI00066FBBDB|nr:response regulator transcription factor [Frateuria defendens]